MANEKGAAPEPHQEVMVDVPKIKYSCFVACEDLIKDKWTLVEVREICVIRHETVEDCLTCADILVPQMKLNRKLLPTDSRMRLVIVKVTLEEIEEVTY